MDAVLEAIRRATVILYRCAQGYSAIYWHSIPVALLVGCKLRNIQWLDESLVYFWIESQLCGEPSLDVLYFADFVGNLLTSTCYQNLSCERQMRHTAVIGAERHIYKCWTILPPPLALHWTVCDKITDIYLWIPSFFLLSSGRHQSYCSPL